jgi:hypothetical protein
MAWPHVLILFAAHRPGYSFRPLPIQPTQLPGPQRQPEGRQKQKPEEQLEKCPGTRARRLDRGRARLYLPGPHRRHPNHPRARLSGQARRILAKPGADGDPEALTGAEVLALQGEARRIRGLPRAYRRFGRARHPGPHQFGAAFQVGEQPPGRGFVTVFLKGVPIGSLAVTLLAQLQAEEDGEADFGG